MRRLSEKGLVRLERAMSRYHPAGRGELDRDADALRDVCLSLGWDWQYSEDDHGRPIGYHAWAKAQLERAS
jgi:hypothetical protein